MVPIITIMFSSPIQFNGVFKYVLRDGSQLWTGLEQEAGWLG